MRRRRKTFQSMQDKYIIHPFRLIFSSMETQKSTRRSSNPWTNLPQEIIIEVLLRLPVKSLLKFRCVSKSWHSIISSPQFKKTHHEISIRNNIYSHKNLIFGSGAPPTVFYACSLYPKVDEDHSMDTVSFDYPLSDPDGEIRIVGSCNGLICVVLDPSSVILWNPATRKYRELPVPGNEIYCRSYGFGYDVFNDDYKVIKVSCIGLNPAAYTAQVCVYSLRNDSWTTEDWSQGRIFDDPGVFVHEAIHWKVYYDDVGSDWGVVAQNLTAEKCSTVALPVPRISSGVEVKLGVSWGLLCAFHDRRSYMDIWVLKEYGVKESWNIMVSFPYSFLIRHPRYVRPKLLFVSENGGILLHLGPHLIMYKESQYNETYHLIDDIELEATTYIESFVSPDFDHMWS